MKIQNLAFFAVLAVAPFAAFAESEAELATPTMMVKSEAAMGAVMETVSSTMMDSVSETAAVVEGATEGMAEVVEDTTAEHANHAEHGMMKKATEATEDAAESLKKSAY